MRLPGTPGACGPLWELGWISPQRLASVRGHGLLGGFLRGARSARAARALPSLAEDH